MKQELTAYELAIIELKRLLKDQDITYKDLAKAISMSESGLKKILSARDGSVARLEKICDYVGVSLAALFQADREEMREVRFTQKQQEYLVANPQTLNFYWLLVYERRPITKVKEVLKLKEKEANAILFSLDRLGLIEILPGDRLKIPPLQQIRWVGDGPLVRKLYKEWTLKFMEKMATPEQKESEVFLVRYIQMLPRTYSDLLRALRDLEREFVRRGIQDMRTESQNLQHVRWAFAVDGESFFG